MSLEALQALAWQLACGGPFPSPAERSGDEHFMALALGEALKGVGLASPNPPVGCVVVKDGRILGAGVHHRAGGPHGEVLALREAARRGEDPRGATAFVTLEPCCHHGRTPPCTDALLRAGIARVVAGVRDPNPRVDGGGLSILRGQGVEVLEGVLGTACARFHAPFSKLIRTGSPWVSIKLAVGSDGSTGPAGLRTRATPPELQALAHALRRASEAIVVGRRTAEVDDPSLTDRWPAPVPPHRVFRRVILDPGARLPPQLLAWKAVEGQPALRVVCREAAPLAGVEDLRVPPGPGGCSLRHLLHELGARGIGRLLVEGGATLTRAFLEEDLADELHWFTGPQPLGGSAVHLDMTRSWHPRAKLEFLGSTWEILEKAPLA
jgi:diaminohydroxyphosphoribosylaminopyrimidine deaminase / 5-amino-6-(5-phosphoribosylamino)uracil reductase